MAKITIEKVKVFLRFGGDDDGLARVGTPEQKQLFESNEWSLISGFFQDAELITKNLASEAYKQKFMNSLEEHCDPNQKNEITKLIFSND